MNITPMDEKEYKMRNTWPVGWYAATICTTEDAVVEKTSEKGNSFFRTLIDVYNSDGAFKRLPANIMASGKAEWQLRAAAEAFSFLDEYRDGKVTPDSMKGKSGFVKLGIETDETGQYDPKNVIRDYRFKAPGDIAPAPPPGSAKPAGEIHVPELDDSIPF